MIRPPGEPLRLGDVAEIAASADVAARAAAAPLGRSPGPREHRVVSVPEALGTARRAVPEADWHVVGARDAVVEGRGAVRGRRWLGLAAWLLLFVGAATTLLNFHADVNMPAAHRELYYLATGRRSLHPFVIEVPYAIGLGLGVLLFFMAPGMARGEPGPLELELWRYERALRAFWRERREGGADDRAAGRTGRGAARRRRS